MDQLSTPLSIRTELRHSFITILSLSQDVTRLYSQEVLLYPPGQETQEPLLPHWDGPASESKAPSTDLWTSRSSQHTP